MGVTGLWTVVQGCARPTKLETLNKKRLAVDASIWIYQFLKAVRDKEGKALRNSHIVGFFRRICKLLFFGIKPVFVFDGGAPTLKRQTITSRKARREGRREDAVRTASKLLAIQMQRRAEEEAERARFQIQNVGEEEIPDNLVYVSELGMTEQERNKSRGFKKKDQYHLPEIDLDAIALGAPNDPRIMNQEELEEYARQFHSGEEINLYDFSKIDFESPFFVSLPASDRYNILNAARLRSRLRMGYSKEQLETMFPDRMAFSRFQIERVKERNELTQRLMNLNGMNGTEFNVNGRIAGEKGKEYVLVKNDGVEGGWALGVVGNKEGDRAKPIDVDRVDRNINRDEDEWEDEDDFEDVPIEGLNRLPKHPSLRTGLSSADDLERREDLYLQRQNGASSRPRLPSPRIENDSLFVDNDEDEEAGEFEDVMPQDSDNEELQRAIAMSLENEDRPDWEAQMLNGPAIDQPLQYNKKNAKAGRAYAHLTNERAIREIIANPFAQDSDEEDESSATFSTPRKSKPVPKSIDDGFSGPLPFESLNLGRSMLGKKKKQEDEAGGFETEDEKDKEPLPPWFSANLEQSYAASNQREKEDREMLKADMQKARDAPILHRYETREIIDVDETFQKPKEVIDVDDVSGNDSDVEMIGALPETNKDEIGEGDAPEMKDQYLSDGVDEAAVLKSLPLIGDEKSQDQVVQPDEKCLDWSDSEEELVEPTTLADNPVVVNDPVASASLLFAYEDSEIGMEFEDVPTTDVDGHIPQQMTLPIPELEDVHIPARPNKPLPQEQTMESLTDEFDDFSDPDDADLLRSLAEETEEHARFAASLADTAKSTTKEDYERELKQLRNQQKRDLRDSDEVTQIMITECQQLLKMFGLPYITAPMEAEAQCAELLTLGLVDGIVTDDSDVFLFGGTRVYKNMFNQAKFVECYLASDLEKEYSLTRSKVIQAAHLLGSDYTEGLSHVGPVTAMEILSEFPSLVEFRDWWEKVQSGQKLTGEEKNTFRRKFKKNTSKVFLPLGFPDPRVDQAYLQPEVDSDPSPFAWGVPDLDALRGYLMATVGWSRERADEILVPVIRDMNRREVEGTQANITKFFGGSVGTGTVVGKTNDSFAPRKRKQTSSRMESALGRIHRKAQQRLQGVEPPESEEEAPKKNRRKKRAVVVVEEEEEEDTAPPRKAPKRVAN